VCNLYSITKNQAAIRDLFRVVRDSAGNLPPMPGVFPDYPAPVVRNAGCGRELIMMRWGMPPPPRTGGPPVTNIRNTSSPHWRAWLKPESRCLVPANSFAEYAPEPTLILNTHDPTMPLVVVCLSRYLCVSREDVPMNTKITAFLAGLLLLALFSPSSFAATCTKSCTALKNGCISRGGNAAACSAGYADCKTTGTYAGMPSGHTWMNICKK
jgi:hypothetical protein